MAAAVAGVAHLAATTIARILFKLLGIHRCELVGLFDAWRRITDIISGESMPGAVEFAAAQPINTMTAIPIKSSQ
jgi:hypothetical protein